MSKISLALAALLATITAFSAPAAFAISNSDVVMTDDDHGDDHGDDDSDDHGDDHGDEMTH